MKLHAAALAVLSGLLITLVASVHPTPLPAQTPVRQGRPGWTPIRVTKWALLGSAVGFAAYALAHSTRADDDYSGLRELCDREPERCRLTNGRYEDPRAESLYQGATREDRRAQVGIFGGQIALLGSAALFIYDLRNGRGPANIPYPSSSRALTPLAPALGIGMRVAF
jgi:hypothetical protein